MIDSGDDNLTRPASGLGTPQFMAPEQFADAKGVTHRCDIYSLGATLYNLLTGQPPFDGKTALAIMTQKEFEKYTPARRLVSGLSERVDAAITAALKPDPLDRPESCLAFFKLITSRTKAHKAPHRTVPQQENGSNRRAWIRHDVGIGSAGSIDTGLHSGGEIETWPLVVRDVSKGGIGLLLARRFESGTELLIEFGEGAPERRRLTAKVIRVQGEKAGHWFHGCRFESPLNEDELKKLVEASTD
jgi:serine/threonine protein kinase